MDYDMNIPIKILYGFHLIEIMIVLIIIGILTSIGLPIYTKHIAHARRLEAETALIELSTAMEEFHFEHNTYQDATLAILNFPEMIAEKNYRLAITSKTAHDYLLSATPLGKQAENDAECAALTLDSTNKKGAGGPANVAKCW